MFFLFNVISDAYAMGPTPQGGGQGIQGLLSSLLPLALIFVVFYFILIRPQQKKAKEHKEMLDSIKKGDKIITAGGIYGVVERVDPKTVLIKVEENTRLKIGRSYVVGVRSTADEE